MLKSSDVQEEGELKNRQNLNGDEVPTIDEQLERIGVGNFHYMAMIALVFFMMSDGMELLLSTVVFTAMPRKEWAMTNDDKARLVTVAQLGLILGALIGGPFADTFGRKPILLAHSLIFLPSTIWSACGQSLEIIYVTRALVGFSMGIMLPPCLALMAEISPASNRGWMILVLPGIAFLAGQLLIVFLGIAATHANAGCEQNCGWWRWIFAFGAVPNLCGLILLMVFMPESPRFQLCKGRIEAAETTLRRMAESNETSGQLRRGGQVQAPEADALTQRRLGGSTALLDFFSSPLRGPLALTAFVWAAAAFAAAAVASILPAILNARFHLNPFDQYAVLFYFTLCEGLAVIVIIFLVDLPRFGRAWFYVAFAAATVPVALVAAIALSTPAAAAALAGRASGGALAVTTGLCYVLRGTTGVPYQVSHVTAAELFPTTHRATGLALAAAAGRLAMVAAPWAVDAVAAAAGPGAALVVVAAAAAAGGAVMMAYGRETVGTALHDLVTARYVRDCAPGRLVAAGEMTGAGVAGSRAATEHTPLL